MLASSTRFSQEVFDAICEEIAEGKSLRSICLSDKMPNKATVLKWINENTELNDQYARAREQQADHYAEEIVHIADTEEDPNKARVRIDARKWVASKLKSKSYGDKQQLEHSGQVELTPIINMGHGDKG